MELQGNIPNSTHLLRLYSAYLYLLLYVIELNISDYHNINDEELPPTDISLLSNDDDSDEVVLIKSIFDIDNVDSCYIKLGLNITDIYTNLKDLYASCSIGSSCEGSGLCHKKLIYDIIDVGGQTSYDLSCVLKTSDLIFTNGTLFYDYVGFDSKTLTTHYPITQGSRVVWFTSVQSQRLDFNIGIMPESTFVINKNLKSSDLVFLDGLLFEDYTGEGTPLITTDYPITPGSRLVWYSIPASNKSTFDVTAPLGTSDFIISGETASTDLVFINGTMFFDYVGTGSTIHTNYPIVLGSRVVWFNINLT